MSTREGIQLPTPAIIEQVKQSKFVCSKCGSARDCDYDAPALLRAVEAVQANPEKSNRAIAAKIGVDEKTVRKARASTADLSAVQERTGLDGKTRKMPEKKAATVSSLPTKPRLETHDSLAACSIEDHHDGEDELSASDSLAGRLLSVPQWAEEKARDYLHARRKEVLSAH